MQAVLCGGTSATWFNWLMDGYGDQIGLSPRRGGAETKLRLTQTHKQSRGGPDAAHSSPFIYVSKRRQKKRIDRGIILFFWHIWTAAVYSALYMHPLRAVYTLLPPLPSSSSSSILCHHRHHDKAGNKVWVRMRNRQSVRGFRRPAISPCSLANHHHIYHVISIS